MKRNILLIIEYDGTDYSGWQSQINGVTVQDTIEDSLMELTKEEIKIFGSGRTDAKVHALGQVANFITESNVPADKFAVALNTIMPEDIRIIESYEVPLEFHSTYNVKKKTYRYLIYNNYMPSALKRNRTCHIKENLDIVKMQEGLEIFEGAHDFTSFCASGSSAKTTIRTIFNTSIQIDPEGVIAIEITGDGFLYKMIRIIVGTLIDVGLNKLIPEDINYILEKKDRTFAGKTAPPQGLYLLKVIYD